MSKLKGDANYRTLMLSRKRSVQLSTETALPHLCSCQSLKMEQRRTRRLFQIFLSGRRRVFISRTSDREWKVALKEWRGEKRDCVESVCPESTVAMRMEWSRLLRRLGKRIAIIPQGEDKEVQWLYWSLRPPHFASFFCTQLYKTGQKK